MSRCRWAYEICKDVQHGVAQDTTVKAIYENTADNVTAEDANYIYEAAVIHLCYHSRSGAGRVTGTGPGSTRCRSPATRCCSCR